MIPAVIETISGIRVNILNPDPDTIIIEDIAHALSHLCRFGGHTPTLYSVAQHSVLCESVAPDKDKYAALMHDATEAYLIDLPSPIKQLFPEYIAIENNFLQVIAKKFEFEYPLSPAVHAVDRLLLETEKVNLRQKKIMPCWAPAHAKQAFLDCFYKYHIKKV